MAATGAQCGHLCLCEDGGRDEKRGESQKSMGRGMIVVSVITEWATSVSCDLVAEFGEGPQWKGP